MAWPGFISTWGRAFTQLPSQFTVAPARKLLLRGLTGRAEVGADQCSSPPFHWLVWQEERKLIGSKGRGATPSKERVCDDWCIKWMFTVICCLSLHRLIKYSMSVKERWFFYLVGYCRLKIQFKKKLSLRYVITESTWLNFNQKP